MGGTMPQGGDKISILFFLCCRILTHSSTAQETKKRHHAVPSSMAGSRGRNDAFSPLLKNVDKRNPFLEMYHEKKDEDIW
jgi:hypothetical protein